MARDGGRGRLRARHKRDIKLEARQIKREGKTGAEKGKNYRKLATRVTQQQW